jgi:hypothetical protein
MNIRQHRAYKIKNLFYIPYIYKKAKKEWPMYQRFLDAIENNAEEITHDILDEIHVRPGTWHYLVASDEVTSERISRVIRDVHARLGNWLKREEPRNMLYSSYLNLGAARCGEGIPLEEITTVLLLIKGAIWNAAKDQIAPGNRSTLNQFVEINYCMNLFFVRIIQSTIAGYLNKQAGRAVKKRRKKQALRETFRV